jgi:hypothetical protein
MGSHLMEQTVTAIHNAQLMLHYPMYAPEFHQQAQALCTFLKAGKPSWPQAMDFLQALHLRAMLTALQYNQTELS